MKLGTLIVNLKSKGWTKEDSTVMARGIYPRDSARRLPNKEETKETRKRTLKRYPRKKLQKPKILENHGGGGTERELKRSRLEFLVRRKV